MVDNVRRVFVLVMAAGAARRFGRPKQLAEYRGETLIRRAVATAEQIAGRRTLIVLGNAWHEVLAACAPLTGYFVLNDRYAHGLSESIAAGIAAAGPVADAVLVTFCDQPRITANDLRRLIDAWEGAPDRIVCCAHKDYRGPPALFPARYFEELSNASGDAGGRHLIAKHLDHVVTVDCESAAADVDTPEDLARL